MKAFKRFRVFFAGLMLLVLMAACATTPQPNATLDEARERINLISDDPQINRLAGIELREARDHLRTAEQQWRDREDASEVSHHARLAMRQADIAQEATRARIADQRVEQLRTEREQLQLQARAVRAEQAAARDRSDRARAEAERARAEADRAAEAFERQRAETERLRADERRREAEMQRQVADEARQLAEERAEELERQTARMQAEAERLQQQLAELEARPTERGLVLTLGSDVLFDFDRADVKPGAQRTLERIAEFLNEYSERQVLIEGFTDSTGSREYNMGLSQRRAEAVRDTLAGLDVESDRMQIRGYGPDHPVASNDNEAGRQLNRRVEVIISDDDEAVPGRAD
jgi:outer membrane protein OmpA-like peptidoglycan-associated protein